MQVVICSDQHTVLLQFCYLCLYETIWDSHVARETFQCSHGLVLCSQTTTV